MKQFLRFALRRAPWMVALLACVVQAPVLGGDFLYDDLHSVRDNPALRELANVPTFFHDPDAFSQLQGRMYRPVLLTTLAWTWFLGAGSHFVHASFDLLLHVLNAALLVLVARRVGGGRVAPLVAGTVFAVHPLAGEAVAMVSARSDQLLLTGFLVAMRSHIAVLEGVRHAWLGTLLGSVVACGSKETGVLLPLVLATVEWQRVVAPAGWRGAPWRNIAARLMPSAGVAVVYLVLRKLLLGIATASPSLTGGTDVTVGAGRDLVTQWATMGELLPRVLAQALVPVGLSIDPVVRYVRDPLAPSSLSGWLLVLLMVGWCWLGVRRRRPLSRCGLVLAVAVALPWILVPLNAPLGEHRLYGSIAGFAMVVAAAGEGVRDRWRRARVSAVAGPVLLRPWWVVGAVLFAWAGTSVRHAMVLSVPESAWQEALDWNPRSVAAHCSLAQFDLGRSDAALEAGDRAGRRAFLLRALSHAERAVALSASDVRARSGLIRIRLALGPEQPGALRAVVAAEESVAIQPRNPFRRLELSQALTLAARATGGDARRFDAAVVAALSTLEIAAPKGRVFQVAAEARRLQGDPNAAVALLDRSIALGLDHADLRCDRAAMLLAAGRGEEARAELRSLLAVDPMQPRARALLQAAGPVR